MRERQNRTSCRRVTSPTRIVHTGVPQDSCRQDFSAFTSLTCQGQLNQSKEHSIRMTSPCGCQDTRSKRNHQQLPGRAIFFSPGQLSTNLRATKTTVTHFLQTQHKPSFILELTWLLPTTPVTQSKDTGGVSRYHSQLPPSLQQCSGTSQQKKQYSESSGRHLMGTKEGDIIDDIQDSWKINHQLCRTSLEHQLKQHQYEPHPISTEYQGSHQMSSIDHLHQEAKMLKVQEHQKLLSAQYLVGCLEEKHTCHNITKVDPPPSITIRLNTCEMQLAKRSH